MRRLAIGLIGLCLLAAPSAATAAEERPGVYDVGGVLTSLDRSAVVATGAAIVEADHGSVVVTASASDLRRLRELRYPVTPHAARAATTSDSAAAAAGFPAADSAYHSYDEMAAETLAIAGAYPALVSRFSLGTSHEGRSIWALKVSDNVAVDEPEPEVLFTHNQHAREHLTVEMALYTLGELTSKYATDARIRAVVDTREIWIVPSVNPDGAEFDVATGSYVFWRKNRQPNAGSPSVGTDLNRNWGFQWGCCGGSSGDFASETYRGAFAFSAPETQRVRDFVVSRRIGGVQQIRASIDFHTYGELIMWPFGYTMADTGPGMTADQQSAFATLGQSMAQTNSFTPEQGSDLYITDGGIKDWLWGAEGVFAYTFELFPTTSSPGFYPPDEVIAAETSRNREAVLRLIEIADCPYRAIGKQAQYCGGAAPPPPPAAPPPAAPPPAAPPLLPPEAARLATPLGARIGVRSSGHVRLRLRCDAIAAERCDGTVRLSARLPGARRTTMLAGTNFVIAARTETVTLRLGPKARRALRSRGLLRVSARVATRQDDGPPATRGVSLTLVRRR